MKSLNLLVVSFLLVAAVACSCQKEPLSETYTDCTGKVLCQMTTYNTVECAVEGAESRITFKKIVSTLELSVCDTTWWLGAAAPKAQSDILKLYSESSAELYKFHLEHPVEYCCSCGE